MNHLIVGVFSNGDLAGTAVAELKEKGYTKDISVISKNNGNKVTSTDVKKDVSDGAGLGAATGATMTGAIAALTTLLVGAVSFVVPGAGVVIMGPIAAGLTGAAAGAVAGGVIGALVDAGFPEEKARMYEHQIQLGDTLVTVSAPEDRSEEVKLIMNKYTPRQVDILPLSV